MIMAEGCIDPTQNDRHPFEERLHRLNRFEQTWIPIGHPRSDADHIWPLHGGKFLRQHFLGYSISTVISWNRLNGVRLRNLRFKELPNPVFLFLKIRIETINEANSEPLTSQESSDSKETKGPYPEVVGSEIGDPRVDEEDMRR
jgi:hypothetical protein